MWQTERQFSYNIDSLIEASILDAILKIIPVQ